MAEGFEGLAVWQKAHELMLFVHQVVVPLLPREEKWDLADQVRRSSKSVGANIAEGHGRFYYRDNVRFCYNARGSLSETHNHLIDAHDLSYIPQSIYQRGCLLIVETHKLLNGYIAYLKRRKPGQHEPGHDVSVEPSLDKEMPKPDDQSTNHQVTNQVTNHL
jgi:four helix bundle protein